MSYKWTRIKTKNFYFLSSALVNCICSFYISLIKLKTIRVSLSLSQQQTRLLLCSNWVNHFDAVASFLEVSDQVNSVVTNVWQNFFVTRPCHLNLLLVQFTGRDQTISVFFLSQQRKGYSCFCTIPLSCWSLT